MSLIVIIGPPAVGKMTVAYELAKLTGHKVFHNHMAIEPALEFFEYGSPEFKHSLLANREEFEKAGTAIQAEFSVPEAQAKGHDKVEVKSVKLSADKKTVLLEMPNIHPVMQMKITANVKAADGTPIKQDVWNSIWKLAER